MRRGFPRGAPCRRRKARPGGAPRRIIATGSGRIPRDCQPPKTPPRMRTSCEPRAAAGEWPASERLRRARRPGVWGRSAWHMQRPTAPPGARRAAPSERTCNAPGVVNHECRPPAMLTRSGPAPSVGVASRCRDAGQRDRPTCARTGFRPDSGGRRRSRAASNARPARGPPALRARRPCPACTSGGRGASPR